MEDAIPLCEALRLLTGIDRLTTWAGCADTDIRDSAGNDLFRIGRLTGCVYCVDPLPRS